MTTVKWKTQIDNHDYQAAATYLSLLVPLMQLDTLTQRFKGATLYCFEAKDILRATRLPVLTKDNQHVAADLAKIRRGEALSPVLLVRGSLVRGVATQIADGYHRVCASYLTDENTDIPCHIIDYEDC